MSFNKDTLHANNIDLALRKLEAAVNAAFEDGLIVKFSEIDLRSMGNPDRTMIAADVTRPIKPDNRSGK